MNTAYVALGANLGDPTAAVLAAFAALANLPESRVARCSSLYRTAPVGILSQPDFVNAVALLETTLAPEALLDALRRQAVGGCPARALHEQVIRDDVLGARHQRVGKRRRPRRLGRPVVHLR